MWNYPFDPNEIEGEAKESPLWVATLVALGTFTVLYFGAHLVLWIIR